MAKLQEDQEFVETVVKALVNNPGKVKTSRTVDEMGVLIVINVDPSDMGILIGRGGQTARALRTLTRVVGAKNNARVNLRIAEPEGSSSEKSTKKTDKPEAPVKEAKDPEESVKELEEDL